MKHTLARLSLTTLCATTLAAGAGVAQADTITVHGTAVIDMADAALLGTIGFAAAEGTLIDFTLSYDSTTKDLGPGSAKLHSSSGGSLVLPYPYDVLSYVNDNQEVDGAIFDHIGVGAYGTRGARYQFGMWLDDDQHTMLPGDPTVYLSSAALPDWEWKFFYIAVEDAAVQKDWYFSALSSQIISLSVTVTPSGGGGPLDADHDGVADGADLCPGSTGGAVTDSSGCAIDQLAPCAAAWASHGAYMKSVVQAANSFLAAGLITSAEKDAIIAAAAGSSCGNKAKP